jgi:hypothetical protein
MNLRILLAFTPLWLLTTAATAQEYRVAKLDEPLPGDAVSPAIAQMLDPAGLRVLHGDSPVVDLWLCKQWPVKAGFQPSASVMYPFEPGTLVGVARYKTRGGDFRKQEIPAGVYTIRYAQQPEDGNHLGTSDTRDFFLLIPAAADREVAKLDDQKLFAASAKAAGTTHPTMLSLLRAQEGSTPAMEHDAARELVSVRVKGQAKAGDKTAPLTVSIVVVGHAME